MSNTQLTALLFTYFTESQYVDVLQDGFVHQQCKDCGRQSTEAHNWDCSRKQLLDQLATLLQQEET